MDLLNASQQPSPAWFAKWDQDAQIETGIAEGRIADEWYSKFVGPRQFQLQDWVVRLTEAATKQLSSPASATDLLSNADATFVVLAGLGTPGLLHVRSKSVDIARSEMSLQSNPNVSIFTVDSTMGAQLIPRDEYFGSMTNLNSSGQFGAKQNADIDAPEAWDITTGIPSVVVGVIDSGVDVTHRDLYKNIWINQGEIPELPMSRIVDISPKDGLITFYDLNNPINLAQTDLLIDYNANGYIDAQDLLRDPLWSDGRDTDGNGFVDDFFGWNFLTGSNDGFLGNNPSDSSGHGTHIAGTIGATGGTSNNETGVVGVNWQTSIMSLRFLDESNRGDLSAAISAINYATMMRTSFGTNLRVLNNSWGQPEGANAILKDAIQKSSDAGILFVAAAGNGNALGVGVDNDRTPFYPSGYDVDNIISVAATDSQDTLAAFSNYGESTVDIAAPGVGIFSTLPGNQIGTANGTSMAAPHVAGAAALLWSKYPTATVGEVKSALLNNVDKLDSLRGKVASQGRLSIESALKSGVFAPTAQMSLTSNVTSSTSDRKVLEVTYAHRDGIDLDSIGDDDLVVQRQWGPRNELPIKYVEKKLNSDLSVTAKYQLTPPTLATHKSFTTSPSLLIADDQPVSLTSELVVSNVDQFISNLRVRLNIRHTWDSDLIVELQNPAGESVRLFDQVGGSGDDFRDTVVSDLGTVPIWSGNAPFTGVFQPDQSLARLLGSPSSIQSLNGIWKLKVNDVFGADGGSLDSWGIDFQSSSWQPEDYGTYTIRTQSNGIRSNRDANGESVPIQSLNIGNFQVRINDERFIYVDRRNDGDAPGRSLREAIAMANADSPEPRTILLDAGNYLIENPRDAAKSNSFLVPSPLNYCTTSQANSFWSDEQTGDFDITGNVTILGDSQDTTIVDAQLIDRVFRVHPGAKLKLERMSLTNGQSPEGQGGGGVLSAGDLTLNQVIVSNSKAIGTINSPLRGGGVASWDGIVNIQRTQLTGNSSNYGAGVFVCGNAAATIQDTTIDNNIGTGFTTYSQVNATITNSTFSGNQQGAIYTGARDGLTGSRGRSLAPATNRDGSLIAFESSVGNLLTNESDRRIDVVLNDQIANTYERISVTPFGSPGNDSSFQPSLSGNGNLVAFSSLASDLVSGDSDRTEDIFLRNRQSNSTIRVSPRPSGDFGSSRNPSLSSSGTVVAYVTNVGRSLDEIEVYNTETSRTERIGRWQAQPDGTKVYVSPNGLSSKPSLSADGRFVAFVSSATNLVDNDTNGAADVFVFDRQNQSLQLISVGMNGLPGLGESNSPSISGDGRWVSFASKAANLVMDDRNGKQDIFLADRSGPLAIQRVSLKPNGEELQRDNLFPVMSLDGDTVVFSAEDDLVLYTYKRSTNRVEWAHSPVHLESLALSGDASRIVFPAWGVWFPDGSSSYDRNPDIVDLYSYNTNDRSINPVSYVKSAWTQVTSSTFVGNVGVSTILGNSIVTSSLFAGNRAGYDLGIGAKSGGWNLMATRPEYGQLGSNDIVDNAAQDHIDPLSREYGFPPVQVQTKGSAGIDKGKMISPIQFDQQGYVRDQLPDIGAVESRVARGSGEVYIDRNKNGKRDFNESGLAGIQVYFDENDNRQFDLGEPSPQSSSSSGTGNIDDSGRFEHRNLLPGDNRFAAIAPTNWSHTVEPMTRVTSRDVQAANGLHSDHLTSDFSGRYVVFTSTSQFNVSGSISTQENVFSYDRDSRTVSRISKPNDDSQGTAPSTNPDMSSDGRFVVYSSWDNKLASTPNGKDSNEIAVEDNDNVDDIFIWDKQTQRTIQITRGIGDRRPDGKYPTANGPSYNPSVSDDGSVVVFESDASNLVSDDTNGKRDIFVWRRDSGLDRLAYRFSPEPNGDSSDATISGDGRIISFTSFADNLVFGDGPGSEDLFLVPLSDLRDLVSPTVFSSRSGSVVESPKISKDGHVLTFSSNIPDLVRDDTWDFDLFSFVFDADDYFSGVSQGEFERLNILKPDGSRVSNMWTPNISQSSDGQYIVFSSETNEIVPGDSDNLWDVFVYDRKQNKVSLVSNTLDGGNPNDHSFGVSISGNGRGVTYTSLANNIVPNDSNKSRDAFALTNPFEIGTRRLNMSRGDVLTDIDFGLYPNPGTLSGFIYNDSTQNEEYNEGEEKLADWLVYLDINNNGIRDSQDSIARTTGSGFEFSNIDSYREYVVRIEPLKGWTQVGRNLQPDNSIRRFLAAGQTISSLEFGVQKEATGGQSTFTVSGIVFDDLNGDGIQQSNERGLEGIEVTLEADVGTTGSGAPLRTRTKNGGSYSFTNLSSQKVIVRAIDGQATRKLGNDFTVSKYFMSSSSNEINNARSLASLDLDQNGSIDLAAAMYRGNRIAVQFNDGSGRFTGTPTYINLASGVGLSGNGPVAIRAGELSNNTRPELVTANYDNGTISIIYDVGAFITSQNQPRIQTIEVGKKPIDVLIGDFTGDGKNDILVAIEETNDVKLLVSTLDANGQVKFVVQSSVGSLGSQPKSLIAGKFNSDNLMDFAVVNNASSTVALYLGQPGGGFVRGDLEVLGTGLRPVDSATGDFDNDGIADIVVLNSLDNTLALVKGAGTGQLTLSGTLPAGTGTVRVDAADIDGDGDVDILVTTAKTWSIVRNRGISGQFSFEPVFTESLVDSDRASLLVMSVANFDNDADGTLDLAIVNSNNNDLSIVTNKRSASQRFETTTSIDNIVFGIQLPPKVDNIASPPRILEDAGWQTVTITGIKPGRERPTDLAIKVTARSSRPDLIPNPVTVQYVSRAETATLSYKPMEDRSGSAIIFVDVIDAGTDAILNTIDDQIVSKSFTVNVQPVNDPPAYDLNLGLISSVKEDMGAQSIPGFVTNITSGGGIDEQSQTVTWELEVDRQDLFSQRPSINELGTLQFTTAKDAFGFAILAFTARDNGGVSNAGNDRKTKSFVLNIAAVNDAPTINIGGDKAVYAGSGIQTFGNFASGFDAGGGTFEQSQIVESYLVDVNRPELFAVRPAIDNAGTLTFTPSSELFGVARIGVRVRDNAGTLDGGVNQSLTKYFDINVLQAPDTTPPQPLLSSRTTPVTNQTTFILNIDFGKVVNGFTITDLIATNANLSNLVSLGVGKYTCVVSVRSSGVVTIDLPSGVAKDLAGNENLAAASFVRVIDTTPPTVSISSLEPNPTNRNRFPVTVQFSEEVTGFSISDLVTDNAEILGMQSTAPGQFVADVQSLADGVVFIGLSSGVAFDSAGNGNSVASPFRISVNTGASTFRPSLSTAEPLLTANRSFDARLDFGRSVVGLETADFVLTNATASLTDQGNGVYTVRLTASSEEVVSVRLPENRVLDANGRPNMASEVLTIRYIESTNSDFGDAPLAVQSGSVSSYPTRLADNGPFHKRGDLRLGAVMDVEADGQPSNLSNGDDLNDTDDEDGIVFPFTNAINAGASATSTYIAIASAAGFIDGWIDFNRDGDWNDPDEYVSRSVLVVAGRNFLPFTIPGIATAGETYGRFRLSSTGNLSFTGPALDGEVEDHSIVLVAGSGKTMQVKADEIGPFNVSVLDGELRLNRNGVLLWSTTVFDVNNFRLLDQNGTSIVDLVSPGADLPGVVHYVDAATPIKLQVNAQKLDFNTFLPSRIVGIQTIDLTATAKQIFSFSSNDLQVINALKHLNIVMNSDDVVVTPSRWLASVGRLESGRWTQKYVNGNSSIDVQSDASWRNELLVGDVDGDASISPLDALILINEINSNGSRRLPDRNTTLSPYFLDPDGDGSIGPLDVLRIINLINSKLGEGEGEGEAAVVDQVFSGDLVDILLDRGSNRKRERQTSRQPSLQKIDNRS